jgi:hypothetical protein
MTLQELMGFTVIVKSRQFPLLLVQMNQMIHPMVAGVPRSNERMVASAFKFIDRIS